MGLKRVIFVALALLACSTCARGQNVSSPGVTLTPVEQGVADVDPLSVSLRVLRPDLRHSTNFERLYEARLDPRIYGPDVTNRKFYVRFAGGVAAVFPQSEYMKYKGRTFAKIPPGTMYSIGGPIAQLMGAPRLELDAKPERINAAQYASLDARKTIDHRAPSTKVENQPRRSRTNPRIEKSETPIRSIFTDDEYRKSRLDALLSQR